MIYDQPCMLEEKLLLAQNESPPSDVFYNDPHNRLRLLATKRRTNLRLVSKKFDTEYSERCEGRLKLFVRTHPQRFLDDMWSKEASSQLNVLHLHLGDFDFAGHLPQEVMWELESVERRLTVLCDRMPRLRTVHLKLYMGNYETGLDAFEEWLCGMISKNKLEALKIISCWDVEKCWDLASTTKSVMVDWKAGQLKAPAVITGRASTIKYAESCCEGLDYVDQNETDASDESRLSMADD